MQWPIPKFQNGLCERRKTIQQDLNIGVIPIPVSQALCTQVNIGQCELFLFSST